VPLITIHGSVLCVYGGEVGAEKVGNR